LVLINDQRFCHNETWVSSLDTQFVNAFQVDPAQNYVIMEKSSFKLIALVVNDCDLLSYVPALALLNEYYQPLKRKKIKCLGTMVGHGLRCGMDPGATLGSYKVNKKYVGEIDKLLQDEQFLFCLKTVVEFQDILWQHLVKYLPTTASKFEQHVPQWVKRPLSDNPYHNLTVTYEFFSASHLDNDDYPLAPAWCRWPEENKNSWTFGGFITN